MDKILEPDLIRAHGSARMGPVTMRKKKDRQVRKFSVVIQRDKDGVYYGVVPELPGCHTQAKSLDDLMARIREAIELCIEPQQEELPAPLDFVGIQRVTVAA